MSSISLNVTELQVVVADYISGSSSRGSFQLLFCLAFFKTRKLSLVLAEDCAQRMITQLPPGLTGQTG